MSKRKAVPPIEARGASTVVVVAASDPLRHDLVAVMAEADCEAEAVARQEALAEYELDARSVVIFFCDVDVPADVTALRRLRKRHATPAIVVVSPRSTATAVRRTLDAGADALVFEPEIDVALATSVRAVESGQSVVPRRLRAGVERPNLSHRERQVLNLVCEGHTNAEIAEALFLAESTIKSHMASIFTKLGVHSRKEAGAAYMDLLPVPNFPPNHPDPDLEEMSV
ncbi:MAG TPA: response regulator transcription factor [Solirubrobacterales bacterium]|nr:response regulator transcription factor [Solirubrobacterales bacterium]